MSTFKGCLEEFPDIRSISVSTASTGTANRDDLVDYFREIAGRTPPLICFLSHIHSDHIQGLDTLNTFVYCSPATRELLLNLEKYPHRMNLAKGILERRKPDHKRLEKLLRAIPLNTPTELELKPRIILRVTLLDANHCAGAVMFLIEDDTKAILYTGDVRSEPWWVNSLTRNPVVLPYTHGHKHLDMMYLDTTFASKRSVHQTFPTKAEGLKELLDKVMMYPKETVFHFHAWTPGYEDVWIALSNALRSRVHVDDYKRRLYGSLAPIHAGKPSSHEGPALFGFNCGNRVQAGCLTSDQNVRLHSCEQGTRCAALERDDVVFISPIVSRTASGAVVPEIGSGGGGGDLELLNLELELDDEGKVSKLMKVCSETIDDRELREKALDLVDRAGKKKQSVKLDALTMLEDKMSFIELAQQIAKLAGRCVSNTAGQKPLSFHSFRQQAGVAAMESELPRTIEFPYSRHSSYDELCDLVKAFRPTDVYPCTVDETNWEPEESIEYLFGRFCSGGKFAHDRKMRMLASRRPVSRSEMDGDRNSDDSQSSKYSREGGVESQLLQGGDTVTGHLERSSPHPARFLRNPSELNQQAKRRRLSPSLPTTEYLGFDVSRERLHNIKISFREHLRRNQGKAIVSAPFEVEGVTHLEEEIRVTRNGAKLTNGTQTEPIELSDTSPSDAEDDARGFLLGEMHEPNSVSNTTPASQSGPETQLSISDAAFDSAFESQPAQHLQGKGADRVQRRKEAYKAVKNVVGIWETDHSLVSSFDGHGEEEFEL